MCEAAAGGRWDLMDRASGVLVADKQSKGESGRVRMGDESRGNPFVLGIIYYSFIQPPLAERPSCFAHAARAPAPLSHQGGGA